jgi:hypothetical protein
LLDRLLAKDPDARFATPAAAVAALPANLEALPVAAPVFQSAIVGPAEPKVTIELVAIPDAARPVTATPLAAPVAPNPPPQLPAEDIASIHVSPAFNEQRFSPLPRSRATNFWLAMLLGAFILLLAQSAAWMFAQLVVL